MAPNEWNVKVKMSFMKHSHSWKLHLLVSRSVASQMSKIADSVWLKLYFTGTYSVLIEASLAKNIFSLRPIALKSNLHLREGLVELCMIFTELKYVLFPNSTIREVRRSLRVKTES